MTTEPGEPLLTDDEQNELDRRLADQAANPGVGRSWAEVGKRLLGPGDPWNRNSKGVRE